MGACGGFTCIEDISPEAADHVARVKQRPPPLRPPSCVHLRKAALVDRLILSPKSFSAITVSFPWQRVGSVCPARRTTGRLSSAQDISAPTQSMVQHTP